MNELISVAVIAGCMGGFFVWLVRRVAIRQVVADVKDQKQSVLNAAKKHALQKQTAEVARLKRQLETEAEELESEIEDRKSALSNLEEDLKLKANYEKEYAERIAALEEKTANCQIKKEAAEAKTNISLERYNSIVDNYKTKLETKADQKIDKTLINMTNKLVETRSFAAQKLHKSQNEELEKNSKKYGRRFLSRTLARYKPNFYWPKLSGQVEIADRSMYDVLEGHPLLEKIPEITESNAELSEISENPNHLPYVKFSGGMGMKKEAAKLAMTQLVRQKKIDEDQFVKLYQQELKKLDSLAVKLGRKAVIDLKINGIHPELQRMIGHLNWRTSYRQNQYLHTFEVAKLAGMLAEEVGEDPEAAKRCGLLHDIGKGIDYRIEGGHAVISGDYADRYGESQLICDTVMSHHNELIVETPLAYVLKSADTLSGARPGARVNLEEGYQIRLSEINDSVRSFKGITKIEIMHGGREVHVDVDHRKIGEAQLEPLAKEIARKIEEKVAFPGQIKVLLNRRFESTAVA